MIKYFRVAVMVLVSLMSKNVLAACDVQVSAKAFLEVVMAGEVAFADMDDTELLVSSTKARNMLPCLNEVLSSFQEAAFHRLMAYEAFFNDNEGRTVAELHASRLLDGGYVFPEEVASEGHPLLRYYAEAASVDPGAPEEVLAPKDGYVFVGGIRNGRHYSNTSVIVHVFKPIEDGGEPTLSETRYIQPGEEMPQWGENLSVMVMPSGPSPFKQPKMYSITSGALAALAGGAIVGALSKRNAFADPSTPDGQLRGLESGANSLATTGLVLGGAAVAVGLTAVTIKFTFGRKDQKVEPVAVYYKGSVLHGP
jgi:hypothetical protein